MNLRRLQASARLVSFQAQAEINPAFCCGLNTCECPACGDIRTLGFARLNDYLSEPCGRIDDSVENGTELWPVGILSVDEISCRSEKEIWVAKTFHDQQRLCIASDILLCQPNSKALFIIELL